MTERLSQIDLSSDHQLRECLDDVSQISILSSHCSAPKYFKESLSLKYYEKVLFCMNHTICSNNKQNLAQETDWVNKLGSRMTENQGCLLH